MIMKTTNTYICKFVPADDPCSIVVHEILFSEQNWLMFVVCVSNSLTILPGNWEIQG